RARNESCSRRMTGAARARSKCSGTTRRLRHASGAAAPQRAVTPCDEGQAVLVAGPARVFRQLELLLGRVPALAALSQRPHLVGGVLHQGKDFLRILLGAEPVVGLARMAGDQPL